MYGSSPASGEDEDELTVSSAGRAEEPYVPGRRSRPLGVWAPSEKEGEDGGREEHELGEQMVLGEEEDEAGDADKGGTERG